MISQEKYNELIQPWQVFYSEEWKRNFFFNPNTNESLWVLPEDISAKVQDYYQDEMEEALQEKSNIVKYIPIEQRMSKDNSAVLKRPAKKQVEVSLSKQYAYKQGDEDYNIWYDKYSSSTRDKDREPAMTRCDPDEEAGFTKADKMDRFSTYFCIHFARGCCAEGVNCRYYHRIPTLDECDGIDASKDIFGRTRFGEHRSDRSGIGSFMQECRTLYVTDFKLPNGQDPIAQMYEIIWRHFSPFGDIEDINIIPGRGMSFIKFAHRCHAEFARVAMVDQALDNNEILTIKWARENEEDEKPKKEEMRTAEELIAKREVNEKRKREQEEGKNSSGPKYESGYGVDPTNRLNSDQDTIQKKQKSDDVDNAINLMSSVLKKIEKQNQGSNETTNPNDLFDEKGNLKDKYTKEQNNAYQQYNQQQYSYNAHYNEGVGYVNPESNNMPLFGKKKK